MSIQQGDPIPNVKVFELDDEGAPRAVGLEQDLSERGLGMRSKCYAMLIEDGKVSGIHVGPPGACGDQPRGRSTPAPGLVAEIAL